MIRHAYWSAASLYAPKFRLNALLPPLQILASALLLRLAVPPSGIAPAAWIALVPLILALRGKSPAKAALTGFAFGIASLAAMHSWFFALPGANAINTSLLFGYLALYPATWCTALALLMRKKLPWVLPGALLWVLIDWLRSHAGFMALPWDPLSHSQIGDLPLLQLAAFGGAPAIAFVVCLTNLASARAIKTRRLPPLATPLILLAVIHGLGYLHLQQSEAGQLLKVALIQPASDDAPHVVQQRALRELTTVAARARPDLVVWPESAVSGFALQPSVAKRVAELAASVRLPILFGSADFGKYAKDAGDRPEAVQFKNEAFLIFPDATVRGPVIKKRLVPFAEYMPLGDRLEWPRWLIARQLHGIAGKDPEILTLRDGTRVGISICWESLFTDLTAGLVRHGASVVVQLSNDSDFGVSAEPTQHGAASILRAVEYGRSVVLASASGPSMLIDPRGRILGSLNSIGVAGQSVRSVQLTSATTVYRRYGLLWLVAASLITASFLLVRLYLHGGRAYDREHVQ